MVTSELADGARFAELAGWSQAERDLAAETIYRFVFRSLYEAHAFNGDPHPGNYLFHGGGRVTFLDFGLVKHFTAEEMQPLAAMVKHLCVDHDPEGFRRAMVQAGFLVPDAPVSTPLVVEHMAVFYDTVRERGPRTMTGEYASAVTRQFFDFRSPLAAVRADPPLLRDPAADQPRPVRPARRAVRDRRLARHRRGDLAVLPGPAVHADGCGRGRLAVTADRGHAPRFVRSKISYYGTIRVCPPPEERRRSNGRRYRAGV